MSSITQARLSRRELLKLGAGASLVLTTAGMTATLTGCSSSEPASDYQVLRASDLPILGAIMQALIGPHPAMPAQLPTALRKLDWSLAHMSVQTHQDVHELLDLLSMGITRGPMTGIWGRFESASPEQILGFLARWRDSRLDMLRQGHTALTQLLLMAWYALPATWDSIEYPGPPVI
ncbi:MAG: twin-arginine translocation pathway signal protein [Pseudomonadaceae bacterium]|nr:MAG: twin-arginine translocation pathway signal protein [Pseudomonadaceae bacterium]